MSRDSLLNWRNYDETSKPTWYQVALAVKKAKILDKIRPKLRSDRSLSCSA
jgi:hypothetical protein